MSTPTIDQLKAPGVAAATLEHLKQRVLAVQERIDAYHPDCARRWAMDAVREARARIDGVEGFLGGRYDDTYTTLLGMSLDEWRVRFAADTLRAALHDVVWAECYAGLRTRDEALADDPWREGS